MNEFQFLNNLKAKYSLDKIGDDCAVLPKDAQTDMLVTADMLVEDIDFRLDWTTPEFLGHKALAVSFSDIASMGGEPKWAMLSIGIPEDLWKANFLSKFYESWFELANEFRVPLVGGDISRVSDKLVIDSIVGGEVPKGKAIMRSGAQPGDVIFVTGSLGGAAGGLELLQKGLASSSAADISTPYLLRRQVEPQPQIAVAKLLSHLDIVTSMIDLSDGLSSDLSHICHQSACGSVIYADDIPVDSHLATHFNSAESIEMALNGGEDFELLFTVNKRNISLIESIPAKCIGAITANVGVIELIRNGTNEKLESNGFRHF